MTLKNEIAAVDKPSEKKKWWTKKKIIIVSVIGAVVLATLIGAIAVISTSVFPIRSSKEELRAVGTVGEYEVKYEELRFLTLMHKEDLDK